MASSAEPTALEPCPCQDLTLRLGSTTLTLNARLGGASWSATYRGVELIEPQPGNGGSLQSACAFDIEPGACTELENPTEAGNAGDSGGACSSHWRLARADAARTEAYTECRMAYYWPPGRPMEHGPWRGPPRNAAVLSDVVLAKSVKFLAPDLLSYRVSFCVPPAERHWFAQFEALAGYMHRANLPRRFTLRPRAARCGPGQAPGFDWLEAAAGMEPPPPRPGAPCDAVVFASADGAVAIGAAATDWPPGGNVYLGDPAAPPWAGHNTGEHKWNFVHHFNAQVSPHDARIPPGPFGYGFLLATGDLARVGAIVGQAAERAARDAPGP